MKCIFQWYTNIKFDNEKRKKKPNLVCVLKNMYLCAIDNTKEELAKIKTSTQFSQKQKNLKKNMPVDHACILSSRHPNKNSQVKFFNF